MITDVLHKRYAGAFHTTGAVSHSVTIFLRQGAQIIFEDLGPHIRNIEDLCNAAYSKLFRELGHGIHMGKSAQDICSNAFYDLYDAFESRHGTADEFVFHRFSLLELLMAEVEAEFAARKSRSGKRSKLRQEALNDAVQELNHRLREADLPFNYHNGVFQLSTDDVTQSQVHDPFWALVKAPEWRNVDMDIKEAIDRRDRKGRDAALYASKALESTIKIISDDKGWSRGTEKGAADYIDNLVSKANGRFIDVWESVQLKALFRDLRNPHGHGPGSAPQPTLSAPQVDWVIECCMIWIKSLVNRT